MVLDVLAEPLHTPVLYQQALSALSLRQGGHHIDGTIGAGGHAAGILEATQPDGQLLGLDRDPSALDSAGRHLAPFGERLHLRHGSFADMVGHATALGWTKAESVLLDLGMSSLQLDDPQRGFSFRHPGPLDMRFDQTQGISADYWVNQVGEGELIEILRRNGEVVKAERVAHAIVAARPVRTTQALAAIVVSALGRTKGKIHPATRVFQAIRIAVNDELEALERGLEGAMRLLAPGGRLVVISFHSLEDRIVKQFMRRESQDCICPPEQPICTCCHRARLRVLTRHPLRPSGEEIQANPRARSARLRVAERFGAASVPSQLPCEGSCDWAS